jgi:hypothetical protein
MMRVRFSILGIAAILFAAAALAAAANESKEAEYVVYVEKLELRAEPSDEVEILKVLKRGARVKNLSEVVAAVEGRYWRRVGIDGEIGWVVDEYVLPDYFYERFKEADEFARGGDAEGMVGAIERSEDYRLSPDGLKVMVDLGVSPLMPSTWNVMYGSRSYYNEPTPLLFFVVGRGLARYVLVHGYVETGEWLPDSRHFVYPVYGSRVGLLDIDAWEQLDLGDLYWEEGGWEHEIIGEYLLWIGYERPENPPARHGDIETPVLLAYDVSRRRTFRLLEADLATLKDKDGPVATGGGYDHYEIKKVPAAPVPAPLRDSKLYEEYNGACAYARE